MHTGSRHQGWKPQKWTGKGPAHSPAAVTIRWEKTENKQTTQTNKQHGKWFGCCAWSFWRRLVGISSATLTSSFLSTCSFPSLSWLLFLNISSVWYLWPQTGQGITSLVPHSYIPPLSNQALSLAADWSGAVASHVDKGKVDGRCVKCVGASPCMWKHESGVAALFHSSDLSQTTQVWQLSHSSS